LKIFLVLLFLQILSIFLFGLLQGFELFLAFFNEFNYSQLLQSLHQFNKLQKITFHSDSASSVAAFNAAFANTAVTTLSLIQWTKLDCSLGLLRQALPNVTQINLGAARAEMLELRFEQFVAALPMHYSVIAELKKMKVNKIVMSEVLYTSLKINK
jgi:hypothetical protein